MSLTEESLIDNFETLWTRLEKNCGTDLTKFAEKKTFLDFWFQFISVLLSSDPESGLRNRLINGPGKKDLIQRECDRRGFLFFPSQVTPENQNPLTLKAVIIEALDL